MNRISSCSPMACWMAVWMASSDGVMSRPHSLFGRRLQGQGVDAVAELRAEDPVDQLVLLDPREAGEGGADDLGAEVMTVSGHVRAAVGQPILDALLDLVGGDHGPVRIAGAILCEATGEYEARITMITFTEKGAAKVQEFLAGQGADIETAGLRVGVRGGGCSGFQY